MQSIGCLVYIIESMYNHLLYLSYWLIDSIVLLAVYNLVPQSSLVLGNNRFNSIESAIYAGFWLTFLVWIWWDFAIARKINSLTQSFTFGLFTIVNILSIWIVSKFSAITGFELTNLIWMLVIGLIVTALQKLAWKMIVK